MKRRPIAVVGLGNMGIEIAARLSEEFDVVATDRDEARREAARLRGIRAADDLPALASAGTVLLSLPHPEASEQVLDRLLPLLGDGAVIVETSTVGPDDAERLAERCRSGGARFLEVALVSGVEQMRKGTAGLLVAGQESLVDDHRDLLARLGRVRLVSSAVGSAMAAKLVVNGVSHAVMSVVVEAGALAVASGVDSRALVDLLTDPDMGITRPVTARYAGRIHERRYEGGMPVEAARKDWLLLRELADAKAVPLIAMPAAHEAYTVALRSIGARCDYSSIAELWAAWGRPASTSESDG